MILIVIEQCIILNCSIQDIFKCYNIVKFNLDLQTLCQNFELFLSNFSFVLHIQHNQTRAFLIKNSSCKVHVNVLTPSEWWAENQLNKF